MMLYSCKVSNQKQASKNKSSKNQRNEIIRKAKQQLGVKYKLGGKDQNGFDCSGFVRYTYASFDINLPSSAAQQSKVGQWVSKEKAEEADLVFFKGGDEKSNTVGHVGIVISNLGNDLEFIHASTSKGIMISKLSESYFKKRFVSIKRIVGIAPKSQ